MREQEFPAPPFFFLFRSSGTQINSVPDEVLAAINEHINFSFMNESTKITAFSKSNFNDERFQFNGLYYIDYIWINNSSWNIGTGSLIITHPSTELRFSHGTDIYDCRVSVKKIIRNPLPLSLNNNTGIANGAYIELYGKSLNL